jgi:hypothetical protein
LSEATFSKRRAFFAIHLGLAYSPRGCGAINISPLRGSTRLRNSLNALHLGVAYLRKSASICGLSVLILILTFCAFASLREIFLRSLAICLEGVNMVLRTFRYGFYKPAHAVESG